MLSSPQAAPGPPAPPVDAYAMDVLGEILREKPRSPRPQARLISALQAQMDEEYGLLNDPALSPRPRHVLARARSRKEESPDDALRQERAWDRTFSLHKKEGTAEPTGGSHTVRESQHAARGRSKELTSAIEQMLKMAEPSPLQTPPAGRPVSFAAPLQSVAPTPVPRASAAAASNAAASQSSTQPAAYNYNSRESAGTELPQSHGSATQVAELAPAAIDRTLSDRQAELKRRISQRRQRSADEAANRALSTVQGEQVTTGQQAADVAAQRRSPAHERAQQLMLEVDRQLLGVPHEVPDTPAVTLQYNLQSMCAAVVPGEPASRGPSKQGRLFALEELAEMPQAPAAAADQLPESAALSAPHLSPGEPRVVPRSQSLTRNISNRWEATEAASQLDSLAATESLAASMPRQSDQSDRTRESAHPTRSPDDSDTAAGTDGRVSAAVTEQPPAQLSQQPSVRRAALSTSPSRIPHRSASSARAAVAAEQQISSAVEVDAIAAATLPPVRVLSTSRPSSAAAPAGRLASADGRPSARGTSAASGAGSSTFKARAAPASSRPGYKPQLTPSRPAGKTPSPAPQQRGPRALTRTGSMAASRTNSPVASSGAREQTTRAALPTQSPATARKASASTRPATVRRPSATSKTATPLATRISKASAPPQALPVRQKLPATRSPMRSEFVARAVSFVRADALAAADLAAAEAEAPSPRGYTKSSVQSQDVGESLRVVTVSARELLARYHRGLPIKSSKFSSILQRGQIVVNIARQHESLSHEVADLADALSQLSMAQEVRP